VKRGPVALVAPARRRRGPAGTPEERIRKATEAWFITEPLLFGAFLTHRVVAREAIGTLRVGEGRVEYNPAFVDALPDKVLEELLRLEAVRIVLKHPYGRRPASGEIAWLASNITLKEHVPTSLPLPSALEVFGDASLSRQYYELYCDRLVDKGGGGATMGAAGAAPDTQGAAQGKPEGGGAPPEDPVKAHLDPARGAEITETWQEDSLAREQIDEVIREIEASHTWGTMPGALVAQIVATLRPRLDYRKVLRGFRTSILSSRRELTRMKPSRRYGFEYMGSRYRLASRLLVAVDVSGSIGDADLEKAFSVINRLFQYGIESIDVLQFDTQITGPVTTFRKRRRAVAITGRGGTSFDPVLRYIEEHDHYDGLIIVTDGYAPRPTPPKTRRARVLWLFHHEATYQASRANVEHVGQCVYIKPDPEGSGTIGRARSRRS
jgi:predicted metal-dependent peptidase